MGNEFTTFQVSQKFASLMTLDFSLVVVLAALVAVSVGYRWRLDVSRLFERGAGALARLASRPALVLLATFVAPVVLGASISALYGEPKPTYHDEFSFLLSGDTFAHGRLTNPPHPLRLHLETIHVLQAPTYSSKYPPGFGLALALGQAVFGSPAWGLWLCCGLASLAITWCLMAIIGQGIVLTAAFLTTAQMSFSYFTFSYFGAGPLAAAGGALALGGIHLAVRDARVSASVIAGLGTGILALTRPFEGLLLVTLTVCYSIYRLITKQVARPPGRRAVIMILGFLAPVFSAIVFLAAHNRAVTGDFLTFPQNLYTEQVMGLATFAWQAHADTPRHDVAAIEYFFKTEMTAFVNILAGLSFGELFWEKVLNGVFTVYYAFPAWGLAALGYVGLAEHSRRLCLLLGAGACVGMVAVTGVGYSHYIAPFAAAFLAFPVAGLALIKDWKLVDRAPGRLVATAMAMVFLICGAGRIFGIVQVDRRIWSGARQELAGKLAATGQKHVVIVQYAAGHNPHEEWVYNGADVDASPVVWARGMEPAENTKVIDYYKDRKVWFVLVSANRYDLAPYEPK